MTYKLEDYLRGMLAEAVSDATDGFYTLSYDHLSIGFFSGELKIKGLDLHPDSAVYVQWAQKDSLPNTYLDLQIKKIEFKGLNIVWLLDRSKLHFDLFEIDSPVLEITSPMESGQRIKRGKMLGSKTLYEMVSPYLNEVSVKEMNLIDADISFVIKDSVESSRYALRDANFQAYGFTLDEHSSQSGKLLLCNDFEFSASREQTLLSDPRFLLKAGNIRLSTQDSIISIRNIVLTSKYDALADTIDPQPGIYVEATISGIDAAGIWFKREDYLNYLDAASFKITGSDIQYVVVDNNKPDRKKDLKNPIDTVSEPWSLYEIISPLLYDVSIGKIGVGNAGFSYTRIGKEFRDHYMLDRLDFAANGFHLDSLSDVSNRFMYSMNYKLHVSGMQARMNSMNHTLLVDRMMLNTEDGNFKVENVRLHPLETRNRYDYIEGSIDSITMSGLDYSLSGIYADELAINHPDIRYVRNAYQRLPRVPETEEGAYVEIEGEKNTFDEFVSFVNDLVIKNILVDKGNFVFDDNHAGEHIRYKLLGLNFYAKDFEINKNTRNSVFGFFDCSNLGFDFNNFDNYLNGKDYRLQIKRARFSHQTGRLSLKGIKLIPQQETWKRTPAEYYSLDIPSFDVNGFFHKNKRLEVASIDVDSPRIGVVKTRESLSTGKQETIGKDAFSFFENAAVKDIRFNNAEIRYRDIPEKDSLSSRLTGFHLHEVSWDRKQGNVIGIDRITVSDALLNAATTSLHADAEMNALELSGLRWKLNGNNTFLHLEKIGIAAPSVTYELFNAPDSKDTINDKKQSGNLYTVLGGISDRITVNRFDITDGSFNYVTAKNTLPFDDLNNLNLNVEGLRFDRKSNEFDVEDIRFSSSDFSFPLNDGFYTLNIGNISLDKGKSEFKVDSIHLLAKYPKMEFAYRHPKHKDWFDVVAGSVSMKGLDFSSFIAGKAIKADVLDIDNVMLRNLKNRQIEVEHNIMPMIYETIQKAPIPLDIARANVRDFSVIYEELANHKTTPGVLSFIGMNGYITGLTNIVRYPDQYIRLDADGKFMGDNPFTAIWMIPVDSLYDCFYLAGHVERFNLQDLNQVTEPLANMRIEKGIAKDTKFDFEASSYGARVNMEFLYNDLKINVLKGNDEDNMSSNKFVTGLANLIISSNNPRNDKSKPKTVDISIERDPYHSTFNYFWQILQPALGESVGVSQKTQNFGKKVGKFFQGVKNFFSFGKKKDKEESAEE